MSLYYVRHGQTEWNRLGKYQGKSDIPLNETGRQQAIKTRSCLEGIKIDHVYCSPLKRAKETAAIIMGPSKLEMTEDVRLMERSFGCFEGCQASDIVSDLWVYSDHVPYVGSESTAQFFARVYACMEELVKAAKTKNILVVAHGGVGIPVQCFFQQVDLKADLTYLIPKNCEVISFDTLDVQTVLPASIGV